MDNKFSTENPATGQVIKIWTYQSKQDGEALIEKAHLAFQEWRHTPMQRRVKIIQNVAKLLKEHKDTLSAMITEQMGKPLAQAEKEIDTCIKICNYTAESGPSQLKDEVREIQAGIGTVTYQPLGVILAMQPWNFPLYQIIRYSVPNILAGNTTVVKHAEIVWGIAEKLAEIFKEAGLPNHVFNVAFIDNETVDSLISHQFVRGVTLTGSAEAGKIVAEEAGKHLKKTVLELGGSDPYIILEDADLEKAVQTCVQGRINNGGQTCVAAKRFIIVDKVYDQFKEAFLRALKNVKVGDPTDKDNDMGPLARKDLREKLHEQVTTSIEMGATCILGGTIPEGLGYFYPPTVLENIPDNCSAAVDELFGPVAALFRAKDETEAIQIANNHRYGLGAGVFSKDIDRANNVARQIESGMVNINCYLLSQPKLPFGGIKESGYGRELGGFGIKEFVNVKVLMREKD